MIPVGDDDQNLRPAIINWMLVAACIAVFLYGLPMSRSESFGFIHRFGMTAANVMAALKGRRFDDVHPFLTIFTSMFLHGDILHIAGNMLFLWVFGNNVEDAMGSFSFLLFYFICGLAAAITQIAFDPHTTVPMIGASGAISGVLGAYLILFPRARVHVMILLPWFIVPMPAVIVLGVWFILQLSAGLDATASEPGVAFWAHIGGFVSGFVLANMFVSRRRRWR